MDKNTPICKSVYFTLLELIIYIGLCMIQAAVIPSAQNQAFFARSLINFLNGYLPLIAAIASTWYVVFTYYLMKSTIEFNQQLSTPFADVSWEIFSGKPKYKAERFASVEGISKRFIDQVAPVSEADSVWVNMIIRNARPKQIGKILGRISVKGESESWSHKPYEARFDCQHIQINRDDSIKIGIADISLVPRDVIIILEILELKYRAIDSTEDLIGYNGEKIFSVRGTGMIVPGSIADFNPPAGETR